MKKIIGLPTLLTNRSKASKAPYDSNNITQRTKDYILNGQKDKAEYEKIKWSKTFLEQLNMKHLYKEYLNSFGELNDINAFAIYITTNAPILSNWEKLFKSDVKEIYGKEINKIEALGDDMYQAYILYEGKEVPYVAVNARTGYFHG